MLNVSDPVKLLITNGAAQVFVSSLLGFVMLIPRQPWGKSAGKYLPNAKDLLAVHLDWLMLAFMQWGAAWGMQRLGGMGYGTAALLLVFGGWANALPYLFRGFGVNAFSLAHSITVRY